jgi:hypothetical protein
VQQCEWREAGAAVSRVKNGGRGKNRASAALLIYPADGIQSWLVAAHAEGRTAVWSACNGGERMHGAGAAGDEEDSTEAETAYWSAG